MKAASGALALALLTAKLLLSMASGPPQSGDPPPSGGDPLPGSVSVAFVTCPSQEVAKGLARSLVQQRLAACVNILPHVTSIYEWKGQLEEDGEVLMMIKTPSSKVPALTQFIRANHPYEVAEVLAVPVAQGNPPYLRWVLGEDPAPETPGGGGGTP